MNKMHSQILVIHPKTVELEDVMYPYQEIDKDMQGKMKDERCQFFLTVKQSNISNLLEEIKSYFEQKKQEYLQMMQYRTEHTIEEFIEKYNGIYDFYKLYIYYCDCLIKYEKIKDLPIDNPEQIKFIKTYGSYATDKLIDIYIKGIGYGTFHNPYQLWDYYQPISGRFGYGTYFLVNNAGEKHDKLFLNELDIDKTISNIKELTYVWEHIIFCKDDPSDSRLYTVDDIRFNGKYNNHCLIDDLEGKLVEIVDGVKGEDYIVTAIDFHW